MNLNPVFAVIRRKFPDPPIKFPDNVSKFPDPLSRLAIEFGSWPITRMTRSEFRDECERVLEVKIKEFCDQIETLALSAGMERTREKRELDHFLWLARHQVKGQTAAEIKRFTPGMERITTDAITKANRALAREQLPLCGSS